MPDLKTEIKKNRSRIFRRAFVKRRDATTGLFEPDWQEITKDVRKWGKISGEVDAIRPNKVKFSAVRLRVANNEGRYNPEDDRASLWNGFANRQRSLLKIEGGFINISITGGVTTHTEYPSNPSLFIGVLHGDMLLSDKNQVTLNARPLLDIFREYPAKRLDAFTSTGLTASEFVTMVRDHTDGSGGFVFRPFFGDTTANWNISATTITYGDLNTNTADAVHDSNVWEIMEKLAEAEQFVPYIDRFGVFNFVDKTNANTTASQFQFHGRGTHNTEFGHTIKAIKQFGKKHTRYYSRVQVQFIDTPSNTSFAVKEATFAVSGTNDVWNLGFRTLKIENFWIPTSTIANSIATALFNEFSAFKNEIKFITTFVPHMQILDRIDVTYISPTPNPNTSWDLSNWAPSALKQLFWDKSLGDAINMTNKEFKLLKVGI
ncbi:MAG: hypothetical protein V3T32_06730, partial [Thermodesulfobacteriota bacterium]